MEAKKRRTRPDRKYSADRPIISRKLDLLGRADFAKELAGDICAWNAEESLVMGIYGAWGSGKTSVKNMVLEELRKKPKNAPQIMEFMPWQLSGSGEIASAFFRDFDLLLRKTGPKQEVEKRSKKLNAYSTALSLSGSAASTISAVMPFLAIPGAPLVGALGKSLKKMGDVSKKGSEALKAKAEAFTQSVHELKNELSALLLKLKQPVLVVIDDIDRLTTDEILQVVQVVKANADFPNVIYLLLFERNIVAKALNKISDNRGDDFLEKIIQVGFHIPKASTVDVHEVLFNEIDSLLEHAPIIKYWDKERWSELYVDGINLFFENLRHVFRFVSSFSFHVRQHFKHTSFEVNPIDLIGLETLRVFEPAVYERIANSKSFLTRLELEGVPTHKVKEKDLEEAFNQIVTAGSPEFQQNVRTILNVLFPHATHVSDEWPGVEMKESWMRHLRVCSPAIFDKYFRGSISSRDLSQFELDRLIELTADNEAFVTACDVLKKRRLLELAFRRLNVHREQIPLPNMSPFIRALSDMSDSFEDNIPKTFRDIFEQNLIEDALRLTYFGLIREPDKSKRFQVLENALSQSNGITLSFELAMQDERNARKDKESSYLLDDGDFERLKLLCVDKFRSMSQNKRYRTLPRIGRIILWWRAWEKVETVQAIMASEIERADDALWLISALLSESHSYGQVHKVGYSFRLDTLQKFIDVSKIENLLTGINEANLSKRHSIALREFRKALSRRAEGKPDIVSSEMEEEDVEVN